MSISEFPGTEAMDFLRSTSAACTILHNLVSRSGAASEYEACGVLNFNRSYATEVVGRLLQYRLVKGNFLFRGGRLEITPCGRAALARLDGKPPP